MSRYRHEDNFLIFGFGLLVSAIICNMCGFISTIDVVCAGIAAYGILRIVNTMSREEQKRDNRRE